MTRRAAVLLIRHAATASTRRFRFPADEPLDDGGRADAAALAGALRADHAVSSPAGRCRETARLAGYADHTVDPDLAELDFGTWAGRDPHEIGRDDPAALERWYADPTGAPPGGEALEALAVRVDAALARLRDRPEVTTAVFTHGGPIKVAVLRALGAPLTSVWQVDVAPCRVTVLHARPGGGWTLVGANVTVGASA